MFVGGKMIDGDQTKIVELEARLIESENKIRHYESIMRNRDQELNMTKKVSRIKAVTQSCVNQSVSQNSQFYTNLYYCHDTCNTCHYVLFNTLDSIVSFNIISLFVCSFLIYTYFFLIVLFNCSNFITY